MMPDNLPSTTPIVGDYLPPDSRPFQSNVDYELGGVAIQDPSQGLMYQVWKAAMVGPNITLTAETTLATTVLRSAPGATYLSLAFDRNMRPSVAYVIGESVFLYWYDTVTNTYVTTSIPNARTPRLTHDDKRPEASSWSDVVLFYVRDNRIYVRNQRDRYLVEYDFAPIEAGASLLRVGMTNKLRLQVEYRPAS